MNHIDFCHQYILDNPIGVYEFKSNMDGTTTVINVCGSRGMHVHMKRIHQMLLSTHLVSQPYSYVMKKTRKPNGMYLDMRQESYMFPSHSRYGKPFLYEWKNDYLVVVGRNTLGLQMTEILDTIHNNPDDYLGLHKWTI